jgi:hypothetical protein
MAEDGTNLNIKGQKSKMQNDRVKVEDFCILSCHFYLCPLIFEFR